MGIFGLLPMKVLPSQWVMNTHIWPKYSEAVIWGNSRCERGHGLAL
jgi:hypothetical protein